MKICKYLIRFSVGKASKGPPSSVYQSRKMGLRLSVSRNILYRDLVKLH